MPTISTGWASKWVAPVERRVIAWLASITHAPPSTSALTKAPSTSARTRPKVRPLLAGRRASSETSKASASAETSLTMCAASESRASELVQKPTPASTNKNTPLNTSDQRRARRTRTLAEPVTWAWPITKP